MMLTRANNDLPDENLDVADIFKVSKIFSITLFKVLNIFLLSMPKNLKFSKH